MSYPPTPPPGSDDPDASGQREQPQYGPPGYGQPPYGQPQGQMLPQTNGKAVAALVVGTTSLVLSVCCVGVVGIVAVVLGFKARSEISRSQGRQSGDGLALGGIITGGLGMLISLALLVLIILAVATGSADFSTENNTFT